ncbi:hypothetical protein [Streptomyces leeuwenhoekii]|nr:hypothetical protein [Streptomyces leeuwenhoekii]
MRGMTVSLEAVPRAKTHIRLKREREIDAIRHRPHPYEFALYYDA